MKSNWNVKDPYGLVLRNAIWLANDEYRQKKKARDILAIDKVAREATDEISNAYTDWDLGCAALVLHHFYNMEAGEISEFLTRVQDQTTEFVKQGVNSDEIWDIVREEVGLDITREY